LIFHPSLITVSTYENQNAYQSVPFGDNGVPAMEVIPEWAFDGRIPCRADVQIKGLTLATIVPCLGLELRRPETRLYAVAMEDSNGCGFKYFQKGNWQQMEISGRRIPVWAWNTYWRRFSLEWEECVDPRKQPSLKIMLYDIDMPLCVRFGDGPATEKPLARRVWKAWPLPLIGRNGEFVISACEIPLLRSSPGNR